LDGFAYETPDVSSIKVGTRLAIYWDSKHRWYKCTVTNIWGSGSYYALVYEEDNTPETVKCVDGNLFEWESVPSTNDEIVSTTKTKWRFEVNIVQHQWCIFPFSSFSYQCHIISG
jgi:hypothetical protein